MPHVVCCIVHSIDLREARETYDEYAEDNRKESLNRCARRNGGGLRDGWLLQHVSHPESLTCTVHMNCVVQLMAGLLTCGSPLGRTFPAEASGQYRLCSPLTVAGAVADLGLHPHCVPFEAC